MSKILDENVLADVVPAPRRVATPTAELGVDIDVRPRAHHHLMDINLEVFESVTDAAVRILRRARRRNVGTSVFTCNVDHLMLMDKCTSFREAYERADVVTIDGAPLALLTKLTGTAEARRVTGVALTEALADQAEKDSLKIALVGGAPGRGEMAAKRLRATHSELGSIFTDSPKMGFEIGDKEDKRLMAKLVAFQPDIVIVCLGAPKQELWIDHHAKELSGAVIVGAGATIDFLSGHQPRAPRVFQATGTEAFYRLATDFRRLWRRYLVRDVPFIVVFFCTVMSTMSQIGRSRANAKSHSSQGLNLTTTMQCGACRNDATRRTAA